MCGGRCRRPLPFRRPGSLPLCCRLRHHTLPEILETSAAAVRPYCRARLRAAGSPCLFDRLSARHLCRLPRLLPRRALPGVRPLRACRRVLPRAAGCRGRWRCCPRSRTSLALGLHADAMLLPLSVMTLLAGLAAAWRLLKQLLMRVLPMVPLLAARLLLLLRLLLLSIGLP
mmetsp:Transcript_35026/g.109012  ORF Transcript_35026/g.109012 Transcript_35026/m.109012 type:complete len:172 (-) Transcript_35026:704-1219(-)